MSDRMVQVSESLLHEILVVAEDALGTDIAGRVRALMSQSTPPAGPYPGELDSAFIARHRGLAEPPHIETGMRVRYRDSGIERTVGDFTNGAWDLLIPGTEKSYMCLEPEVFWQTVELVAEPLTIREVIPPRENI